MNTYTFTKWMTEEVISEFHGSAFPVAIVRPSIVVRCLSCSATTCRAFAARLLTTTARLQGAIAKHPYPGYFGNSAGPTAYFLAFGSGEGFWDSALRHVNVVTESLDTVFHARAGIATMTCHRPHNVFDVVPADVVGSVILATSAATVQVHSLWHAVPFTISSLAAAVLTCRFRCLRADQLGPRRAADRARLLLHHPPGDALQHLQGRGLPLLEPASRKVPLQPRRIPEVRLLLPCPALHAWKQSWLKSPRLCGAGMTTGA